MADSNYWITRVTAGQRQDAETFLDVLEINALPPAHAGSHASPQMAGQFRQWLAEPYEGGMEEAPESARLGFSLNANSTPGEKIIASFELHPGPVVFGFPDSDL